MAANEDVKKSTPTQLSVAAAADLKFALDDLVKEFEGKNPATKVNVTYGSSGNFFAQLQSGAPFDVFLSADVAYPRKLAEQGLDADEVFLYAIGRIVVWVPKNSPLPFHCQPRSSSPIRAERAIEWAGSPDLLRTTVWAKGVYRLSFPG